MSFTLTGSQVIAFVVFLIMIGPSLLGLGRLWERVTKHERLIAALFEKMTSIDEKLVTRIDQVERRLLDKIEENGYKNCPVAHPRPLIHTKED